MGSQSPLPFLGYVLDLPVDVSEHFGCRHCTAQVVQSLVLSVIALEPILLTDVGTENGSKYVLACALFWRAGSLGVTSKSKFSRNLPLAQLQPEQCARAQLG